MTLIPLQLWHLEHKNLQVVEEEKHLKLSHTVLVLLCLILWATFQECHGLFWRTILRSTLLCCPFVRNFVLTIPNYCSIGKEKNDTVLFKNKKNYFWRKGVCPRHLIRTLLNDSNADLKSSYDVPILVAPYLHVWALQVTGILLVAFTTYAVFQLRTFKIEVRTSTCILLASECRCIFVVWFDEK